METAQGVTMSFWPKSMRIPLLSILVVIAGCNDYSCPSAEEGYKETFAFGDKMRKEKQWRLMGIGGCYDSPHLRTMSVDFYCQQITDVDGARKLIVEGVEEFLKDINANPKMQPYLPTTPLTYKNIFLGLHFTNRGEDPPAPYIIHAFLLEGSIAFYAVQDTATGTRTCVLDEPFETAQAIVAAEKAAIMNCTPSQQQGQP